MEIVIMTVFTILMIAAAVYDIRTMHIPLWLIVIQLVTAGAAVVNRYVSGGNDPKERICRLILLSVIMAVSLLGLILHADLMGAGDMILILSVCIVVPVGIFILISIISMAMAGMTSGVLLILKRVHGKSRIPFIPFLAAGTILGIYTNIRGLVPV